MAQCWRRDPEEEHVYEMDKAYKVHVLLFSLEQGC